MIVIGSKALLSKIRATQDDNERYNKSDYDVIMSNEEFNEWYTKNQNYIKSIKPNSENKYKAILLNDEQRKQYEIEIGFTGTSSEFLLNHVDEVCEGTIQGFLGETLRVLNLHYQLLTKRSHLIYPVHFEKNMADYQILKQFVGEFPQNETMNTYCKLRSAEAKERYKKYKTPKLNVTNEDFFSSKLSVEKYFIHDDIHEVMKHHEVPVYEMMKRDFGLAKCEKDMFFSLPFDHQIQSVQEEAYVIALERYIIPQDGDDWMDYFNCYKKAVKRICTTLCSGWFRDFAIENYNIVLDRFNPLFVHKFKSAFDSGIIKPIEGKCKDDVPQLVA